MLPPIQITIPPSKSMALRALTLQSDFPKIEILGSSESEDVRDYLKAQSDLEKKHTVRVGRGAAGFRFLTLQASRKKGRYSFFLDPQLAKRPFSSLIETLKTLGSKSFLKNNYFYLESPGWTPLTTPIDVCVSQTSQVASGLLMASLKSEVPLSIKLKGDNPSENYFLMTLRIIEMLGGSILKEHPIYTIDSRQSLNGKISLESDMSSAAALAALSFVYQRSCEFLSYPHCSIQPDAVWKHFFCLMGFQIKRSGETLQVKPPPKLRPLIADLTHTPDLFPILAGLAAYAEGESQLLGQPLLQGKESPRRDRTKALLEALDIPYEERQGLCIYGGKPSPICSIFNVSGDHRMAFAATLFAPFGLRVNEKDVVKKSLPEFWNIHAELQSFSKVQQDRFL